MVASESTFWGSRAFTKFGIMNTYPQVSIIIPFLNAEKFLDEAIRSGRAQTYDSWVLLLADDGSTDGSGATARRYADRDPSKVRCVEHPRHENCGRAAEVRGAYLKGLAPVPDEGRNRQRGTLGRAVPATVAISTPNHFSRHHGRAPTEIATRARRTGKSNTDLSID